ncbi:hypothetical protein [Flavobacterium sp. N1994]|nr:hypothetical protein [Flavobacterium sp. N1994]
MARIISEATILRKTDCYAFIIALSDIIGNQLAQHRIIKIDN